jgi:uncharacterized protein YcfJ
MKLFKQAVPALLVVALLSAGCATQKKDSKAVPAAVIGSLAGAGLGAIIGHQSGEAGAGAAIGAAVGGAGGYVIGNEQDKAEMAAENEQTAAQARQALETANTLVINVKNSNGSITPVTLRRDGNEWVGPKGERYLSIPTEDQLRPVYGF